MKLRQAGTSLIPLGWLPGSQLIAGFWMIAGFGWLPLGWLLVFWLIASLWLIAGSWLIANHVGKPSGFFLLIANKWWGKGGGEVWFLNDALSFDRGGPRGHFDYTQVILRDDDGERPQRVHDDWSMGGIVAESTLQSTSRQMIWRRIKKEGQGATLIPPGWSPRQIWKCPIKLKS